jgi:hypothetical protein
VAAETAGAEVSGDAELGSLRTRIGMLEAQLRQAIRERDQHRGELLALTEALENTFTCDLEPECHEEPDECWSCWATLILKDLRP